MLGALASMFKTSAELRLENLALRQQLAVLLFVVKAPSPLRIESLAIGGGIVTGRVSSLIVTSVKLSFTFFPDRNKLLIPLPNEVLTADRTSPTQKSREGDFAVKRDNSSGAGKLPSGFSMGGIQPVIST